MSAQITQADYDRMPWRATRFMTIEERLWPQVKRMPNGCLEWTGGTRKGYGGITFKGNKVAVHRVAWELANGPILDGMDVLHHCDNPPCVDVTHLFLGTDADNCADMAAKGRHHKQRVTHCPQGHPYDETNTYITPNGRRNCRACRRVARRRSAAKKGTS